MDLSLENVQIKPRFAIPDSMIYNVLRCYYDDMAHCGVEKTIQGLNEHYWFPSSRKRVRDYVNNCLTCLISNSSINCREGELQIVDSPKAPYEIVHCNHFGHLTETSDGYKHILILVDAFLRFTWLFPVKSTGTKEVLKHFSFFFIFLVTPKNWSLTEEQRSLRENFLNF